MFQLLQAMFSTIAETWHGPTIDVRAAIPEAQDDSIVNSAPSVKETGNNKPVDQYADEIKKIEDELYGGHQLLKSGTCIDITLQELLQIIPRRRRRIDAYRGLQRALSERRGVTLRIKSNKTK
ncbi:MAG: hypothetical protein IJM58_04745 [Muribaculaceae bacterium]|jgi:hypothetical protein|nr:hypothetical protein [Muribaculaceae bacterium]